MNQRRPTPRDKAFLKFVHRFTAVCCQCRVSPFEEAHHFGTGGIGLKGSDYLQARLCRRCHRIAFKQHALQRNGDYETLVMYYADAVDLMERYIIELLETRRGRMKIPRCVGCEFCDGDGCRAQLPHIEPPTECATDELVNWLAESFEGDDPGTAAAWLLDWANRRASEQNEVLVEALETIADNPDDANGDNGRTAIGALRRIGKVGD